MFLTRGACEESAPTTCLDFATEQALCSNGSNMGKKHHMLLLYPIWQSKSTSTNKNHVKKLICLACVELCSLNLQAWNAPMNHEGEAKSALVLHSLEKNLKCTRQDRNLRYKRILLHLVCHWLETWISICLDVSLTSLRQKLGYVFEDIQMENTGCDTWKNIHWNGHWWWCPLLCLVREGFSPSASLWKYHRLMMSI